MRVLKVVAVGTAMFWTAVHADGQTGYFTQPQAQDAEGFRQILTKVAPRVYMSGQPSQAGLARARDLGVTTVINLRTQVEMDDREVVDFDEAGRVAELGLQYVHIPSGGPDTPYTPAAVEEFARAVAKAEGDVLLHCTVARRATHLWTAYLIKHHNVPFVEAIDIARGLNLGTLPLEGFLGEPLTIGPRDE